MINIGRLIDSDVVSQVSREMSLSVRLFCHSEHGASSQGSGCGPEGDKQSQCSCEEDYHRAGTASSEDKTTVKVHQSPHRAGTASGSQASRCCCRCVSPDCRAKAQGDTRAYGESKVVWRLCQADRASQGLGAQVASLPAGPRRRD